MLSIKHILPEPWGWIVAQAFLGLIAVILFLFGVDLGLLIFTLIVVSILNGWFWVQE